MKQFSRISLAAVFTIAALVTGVANADIWVEAGDAPDGVPDRQDTIGLAGSTLDLIMGSTNGTDDVRDTFSIIITDPQAFYATTTSAFGNGDAVATWDTRLYLWDENGNPVMMNDDSGLGGLQSLLSESAFPGVVDPTVVPLVAGGKYLLTITGFNDDALDIGGGSVFDPNADFDALHGPVGGAFDSWGGDTTPSFGDYTIELGGATFCGVIPDVPEPGTAGLLLSGLVGLCVVRRRNRS